MACTLCQTELLWLKRRRETGHTRAHNTQTHTHIFSRVGTGSLRTVLLIVGLCCDLFGESQITAHNITSSVNMNRCAFIASPISFFWRSDLTIIDISENLMQLSFLLVVTVFELWHLHIVWVYCKSFLPWINFRSIRHFHSSWINI